jgi:GT2 family glycosyltransferase
MDLSIIIVNWCSANFLRNCLLSIYANTRGLEFEVIVVDDASFDGCDRMVFHEFPQVRFVQSETNVGFARANNLGVEQSCGESILFLNPDTEVVGPAIAVLWRYLESQPDAGAVGARLLNSDRSLQSSCIQAFPTIVNQALDSDFLRRRIPKSTLWGMRALFLPPVIAEVDAVSGACLMVSRSALRKVKGFSSCYFMYSEDVDLCRKLRSHGRPNYFVSSAEIVHHGGGSSSSKENNFAAVAMRESRFRYMRIWSGWPSAIAYRAVTGLVAVGRIAILELSLLAVWKSSMREAVKRSKRKWMAIFGWAIGFGGKTKSPMPPSATPNGCAGFCG